MGFNYNTYLTIGVRLEENQVRNEDRSYKDFVYFSLDEDENCDEWYVGIRHPEHPNDKEWCLELKDTGESSDRACYFGEHNEAGDYRHNPDELFVEVSPDYILEFKAQIKDHLEPWVLWDESKFGFYVWADIR